MRKMLKIVGIAILLFIVMRIFATKIVPPLHEPLFTMVIVASWIIYLGVIFFFIKKLFYNRKNSPKTEVETSYERII